MKAILPLFIFIDACGWEIIKNDPFCNTLAPNRRRLESVFGYSSACVPSILSGRWPDEHRNWCYFVYDPKHSPFRMLKPLQWLQHFERRVLRVINEVAPVAMLIRPASGKNGRHARRTIAKDGVEPSPIRRNSFAEGILFDDFPSAGVNEDEQGKNCFHCRLIGGGAPSGVLPGGLISNR